MIPNVAEIILESERSPIRFENFCIELLTQVEGIQFVPTSTNYDRSRDGRAASPTRAFLGATTEKERKLDAKVRQDSTGLAKSNPHRVAYCISTKLTEHRLDELEKIVRKILKPSCSVTMYSAIQLAALAHQDRYEPIFRKHYRSELDAIESRLRGLERDQKTDDKGLRLAVLAFASADARNLKETLARKRDAGKKSYYGYTSETRRNG